MAQISYEHSQQLAAQSSQSNQSTLPQFFFLRGDNEEAVVRIMHDNTASFEIVTVHEVMGSNGKMRKVNCIRDPREPLENCPLCNSGAKVHQLIFIHMLQYVRNEQGVIVPQPVIWERSVSYAERLKGYIDNYGPLSDIMCKIVRHGQAGDRKTTYDIIPNLSPQMFSPEQYPKVPNAFDNYSVVGTIVLEKNYADLDMYVRTGQFPATEQANNTTSQPIPPANIPAPPVVPASQAAPFVYPDPVLDRPQAAPVSPQPAFNPAPGQVPFAPPVAPAGQPPFAPPAFGGPAPSAPEQQVPRPIRRY